MVHATTREVRGCGLVVKREWGLPVSRDGKPLDAVDGLSDNMRLVDTARMKFCKTVEAGRVLVSVMDD